jgi:hypothetical protein
MDAGGEASRKDVIRASRADGIAPRKLDRAIVKAGIVSVRAGFPAVAVYRLPVVPPPPTPASRGETVSHGETVADLHKQKGTTGWLISFASTKRLAQLA